jgi:hypothetical protein
VAEFGPKTEQTEFVAHDLLLNYPLTQHQHMMSTYMNNTPNRFRTILLIALVTALPLLGSCGIPTDEQPRDIDPSQQINLNKP